MENNITTKEAMAIVEGRYRHITKATMIVWAKQYGFGGKIGGRWIINKEKLLKYLEENLPT